MAGTKIEQLSVGDWVAYKGNPVNIWVLGVTPYGFAMEVLSHDQTRKFTIRLEDAEPIPLTPEILEKNGFRKNGEYNEWNIGEWNERPFIGISLDRQSMRVKHLGSDIFVENKVVCVHQLQHALRLAGVEKEIEI